MKHSLHIKTGDYEFIEAEVEGTADEAVEAYRALKQAWDGGPGLGMKEFAKVVYEYVTTGGIPNGGNNEYSTNETLLLRELTKLIRANK